MTQINLNTKRITINIFCGVIAFVLNTAINFFITPYITGQFGAEAYGFVKLANDFTSYASLFSIALNSMASRFIMLESTKGNIEEARKYYSSITLANIILTAILAGVSFFCVVYLDKLFSIPITLVLEVKITFAITFASFLCNLLFSTYGNCYYLTNRLDIGSLRDALMYIIKAVSIVALFVMVSPRISFVALGSLLATIFAVIVNIIYTKKLTPNFNFCINDFDKSKLVEVLMSGIWNSITKLSQIFSSGLDLMVTNLFIGSVEMGYLAVAKTIPTLMASFNATIANVFSPNLMQLYAQNDMKGLRITAKSAMKFMCLFVTIPNAILITIGQEFFELWVPGQPASLINILAILTIINSCVTGPMQPLYQIFTITNKIKQSSIVMVVYGFLSIAITFVCLKTTGLGLYAVVIVSLIGSIIVAVGYHLPYAAIYIGLPWNTFYPEILRSLISLIVGCLIGWGVKSLFELKSWVVWFIVAVITAIISFLINILLILNLEERKKILKILRLCQ